jgi:NAD(P)H-dependent FMN reductase
MKVLFLNGSPRQEGHLATLLNVMREELEKHHAIEWVDAYELEMANCTSCMECRKTGECVLPRDDAHRVGELLTETDGVVVGTPTHWRNMSAPLKLLFDRNAHRLIVESSKGIPKPRHKGKPAAILTTCTTPWPFNILFPESRAAIRSVKYILKTGGYRIAGTFALPGTKSLDETPEAAKRRVKELARSVHGNLG